MSQQKKENEKKKEPLLCYECKKFDHFKVDYPTLKKTFKRSKKKAMVVTWSNSDELSSDEEIQNEANLCFMA